jgi:hypothetical protein
MLYYTNSNGTIIEQGVTAMNTCKQCDKELDLIGFYSTSQLCNDCAVKEHKAMVNRILNSVSSEEIARQSFDNLPRSK